MLGEGVDGVLGEGVFEGGGDFIQQRICFVHQLREKLVVIGFISNFAVAK